MDAMASGGDEWWQQSSTKLELLVPRMSSSLISISSPPFFFFCAHTRVHVCSWMVVWRRFFFRFSWVYEGCGDGIRGRIQWGFRFGVDFKYGGMEYEIFRDLDGLRVLDFWRVWSIGLRSEGIGFWKLGIEMRLRGIGVLGLRLFVGDWNQGWWVAE